ncbi:hypothetical protein ACH5RR_016046 [Cinchona calisaya]|uniref:F-box domain-containing protein n=1 Tax=Cinchona calisaya TaxID=153742 RepID=A0ABD2ZUV3_9GENT
MKRQRRGGFVVDNYIPHDIMVQVLARIPAKSLMRFMCVCKLWNSTIRDPKFAELHRQCSHTRLDGNYFITFWYYEGKIIITSKDHQGRGVDIPIKLKLKQSLFSYSSFYVHQPLDGLVCIDFHDPKYRTFVLNLATCQAVRLPKSTFRREYWKHSCHYLCFDPVSKEYKVLNLCEKIYDDFSSRCEIYTLGTDSTSRRKLQVIPPKRLVDAKASVSSSCNGAIYWMTFDGRKSFLVVFDVSNEIFRVVRFSEPINSRHLAEVGGRLSTLKWTRDYGDKNCRVSLWFLEEYDNRITVSKMNYFPTTLEKLEYDTLRIGGICPEGDIVLIDENKPRNFYLSLQEETLRVKRFRASKPIADKAWRKDENQVWAKERIEFQPELSVGHWRPCPAGVSSRPGEIILVDEVEMNLSRNAYLDLKKKTLRTEVISLYPPIKNPQVRYWYEVPYNLVENIVSLRTYDHVWNYSS